MLIYDLALQVAGRTPQWQEDYRRQGCLSMPGLAVWPPNGAVCVVAQTLLRFAVILIEGA